MKQIIINNDNLIEKDIDDTVIRTKALIINSKNEIMLGYSNKTYQFPGGHLEKNETLEDSLKREIKEETGIEINKINKKPFMKITCYSKNYRNTNKNRRNDIYYYIINTDKTYNKNKTNLDKQEIENNFTIKNIPLTKVEETLIKSIPDNSINKLIVNEMLEVLKEYKKTSSLS